MGNAPETIRRVIERDSNLLSEVFTVSCRIAIGIFYKTLYKINQYRWQTTEKLYVFMDGGDSNAVATLIANRESTSKACSWALRLISNLLWKIFNVAPNSKKDSKMEKLKDGLKIYLSGAISGTTDYVQRFAEAELLLKKHGNITVLNPVGEKCKNYAEYMERAMHLLKDADAVFIVKDAYDAWFISTGVRFERAVAEKIGIPIVSYSPYFDSLYQFDGYDISNLFDE